MNTAKLMAIIEAERSKLKMHKTSLCAKCGISTTYYNTLLEDKGNPSLNVVVALLKAIELDLIICKVY